MFVRTWNFKEKLISDCKRVLAWPGLVDALVTFVLLTPYLTSV